MDIDYINDNLQIILSHSQSGLNDMKKGIVKEEWIIKDFERIITAAKKILKEIYDERNI